MEPRKMILMNLSQGSSGDIDIENRLMDMQRGEERVRCIERVTWKLTLPYVKIDAQWESAIWLRKLKQGLCINLEGWDGVRFKREVIYV